MIRKTSVATYLIPGHQNVLVDLDMGLGREKEVKERI